MIVLIESNLISSIFYVCARERKRGSVNCPQFCCCCFDDQSLKCLYLVVFCWFSFLLKLMAISARCVLRFLLINFSPHNDKIIIMIVISSNESALIKWISYETIRNKNQTEHTTARIPNEAEWSSRATAMWEVLPWSIAEFRHIQADTIGARKSELASVCTMYMHTQRKAMQCNALVVRVLQRAT